MKIYKGKFEDTLVLDYCSFGHDYGYDDGTGYGCLLVVGYSDFSSTWAAAWDNDHYEAI